MINVPINVHTILALNTVYVYICTVCTVYSVCTYEMYVCMYVYTYELYVCMYVYMYCLYICTCMYVLYVHLCKFVYVCMYGRRGVEDKDSAPSDHRALHSNHRRWGRQSSQENLLRRGQVRVAHAYVCIYCHVRSYMYACISVCICQQDLKFIELYI